MYPLYLLYLPLPDCRFEKLLCQILPVWSRCKWCPSAGSRKNGCTSPAYEYSCISDIGRSYGIKVNGFGRSSTGAASCRCCNTYGAYSCATRNIVNGTGSAIACPSRSGVAPVVSCATYIGNKIIKHACTSLCYASRTRNGRRRSGGNIDCST